MRQGPFIFLAAFFALSASWCAFVLAPQIQIGREQQVVPVAAEGLYPPPPPGLAREGLDVYRANGCVYCHSQQVRQTGIQCDLILDDIGTNPVAVVEALSSLRPGTPKASAPSLAAGLPKPIVRGLDIDVALRGAAGLKEAGAKIILDIVPQGPDIVRGWGRRRTVAQDFLFDSPLMPGSLRVGPDLANVGSRLPDANWHYRHLYAPQGEVKGSLMPPYKFLFEERKLKPGEAASPDAIPLTAAGIFFDVSKDTGGPDREIVPKPEARALVAYLLNLRPNVPLFEAPVSPLPAPATNTAAGK